MISGSDFYQILGVPRDATAEEIRAAYFEAARKLHPDANPDPSTREKFLAVQQAYEVLSQKDRRQVYDQTLPPPPPPLQINLGLRYSRSVVPFLNEPQLVYTLVELACTGEPSPQQYPPLHVCLVVDRSTSMKGERMDMVKSNMSQFLRLLKPQDMVSIVTYSDRSEVLLPLSRVTDLGKIESKISMISTGGGTEIFQGLEAGYTQLQAIRNSRSIKQLILLTDGQTYGDEEDCFELAERAAQDNISINALGIGHEWNDAFLDKLATMTGGFAFFVTSGRDLYRFFETKLVNLGLIYARGITFDLIAQPDVSIRYAFRVSSEAGPLPLGTSIPLGDLSYGKTLSFLLEFYITKIPEGEKEVCLADGRLRMHLPLQNEQKGRLILKLTRPLGDEPEPELPSSAVLDALSHLSLYRLQEKARHEVEDGNIPQATKHLQHLATHLLSNGNRELAHTVLVEAEHIQQSKRFSRDGDKRIKYGTRALLLPSGLE